MTFIILQGHRLLVILALLMACFLEEAQNLFSISMSHVTKNLLKHWRMKLKLQLQTHQSNAQLKIQVFVMIQCWLFEMLETADRMTHCHIAEDLLFSSVTVTSSDDIVNSQLCRAQPLDMHVKCRSGLGIIYQTLIQFILSSVTGQTYVCVCGFSWSHQNFHCTKDGTWVREEY